MLVPTDRPHDPDLENLRARVSELEAAHGERRAEVAHVEAGLASFKIRYRADVGLLHEELDRLELALAEAELGELSKRTDIPDAASVPADTDRIDAPPRLTSDAVRKLFRDVAKAIHPDLAGDHLARDRRHSLMIEANRAYALGDEEQLRLILQAWERSPEAVQGSDAEAMRSRLIRRRTTSTRSRACPGGSRAALRSARRPLARRPPTTRQGSSPRYERQAA
jgi:hypothetical protein